MPYASNSNAVLFDNCNNLQNLTVLLEVGSDISTVYNSGWTLQLNCFPPPGHVCQTIQVNWLQFVVFVQNGVLQWGVQYWAYGATAWPPGVNAQEGTSPWLPCWPTYSLATFATGLSGDTLPSGSLVQILLGTDSNGGIETATFTYIDPEGGTQTGVFVAPVVHPICAFEVNFGGILLKPWNGIAVFKPQVPDALIRYSVSPGELSVQSAALGSVCGEAGPLTGETSNMVYSDIINGAPGSTVTQALQTPQQLPPFVTPSKLTFCPQQIETDSPQQTVMVVVGPGITVTGISLITVFDAPQFICVPPPGASQLDLQDGVLVITVWSHPTVVGPRNAQLQIAISDGSTLVVELYGMGVAVPVPLLTVSPGSLLFTTKSVTNHTVTLTNPGTAPLTIMSIVIDGSSSFTFGTTCNVGPSGGILNPGQQCTITVAHRGAVDGTANPRHYPQCSG
jgi:hypothetical protein